MGGKQSSVFLRGSCVGFQFRQQMLRIPDTIIHPSAIAIDERHFLWRIELRKRTDARAHEKAQILVRRADHVGIEKRRMPGIVNRRKYVGDRKSTRLNSS